MLKQKQDIIHSLWSKTLSTELLYFEEEKKEKQCLKVAREEENQIQQVCHLPKEKICSA